METRTMYFSLILTMLTFGGMSQTSPNIIYIITDDMGYADISARESEFETPHLDNLYDHSIVLNSHYIGLLCSPSRSQILSGRYAWNMGLSAQEPFGPTSISAIPGAFPTIADILGEYTNYKSYALGKWHVGYSTDAHGPLERGFDHFYGFYGTNIMYANKSVEWSHGEGYKYIDWWEDKQVDLKTWKEYSTFVSRDKTIEIIEKHSVKNEKNKNKITQDTDNTIANTYTNDDPFFMYLAFQAPHFPMEYVETENMHTCDRTYLETSTMGGKYISNDDSSYYRYLYCLNMVALDNSIGDIVSSLKENNIWDNTMIVFTSDNGGEFDYGGCNYPLRGNKATYYDGGAKTLTFIGGGYMERQPVMTEKETSSSQVDLSGLMHGTDWVPTLLSMAGAHIREIDADLQSKLYRPLQENLGHVIDRVAPGDEEEAYNQVNSFDGMDLSQWLLTGDEDLNSRMHVGLTVIDADLTGDSMDPSDPKNVAIVFKKNDILYKFMYLEGNDVLHNTWCELADDRQTRSETVDTQTTTTNNIHIYDLTHDPREMTDLYSESDDWNLVNNLIDDAKRIIDGYLAHPLHNGYLECHTVKLDFGNPEMYGGIAYEPFLTWTQYVDSITSKCQDDTNDLLLELMTTRYKDY